MRIIMTGPTGCIGHALLKALLSSHPDAEIYAVIRPDSANAKSVPEDPRIHRVFCELSNLRSLSETIPDGDYFYHLGWSGTYGESRTDEKAQSDNVEFTLDAVRLAKKLHCHTFLLAGSQGEYGKVGGKISPDTPCHPDTAYGRAKLRAGILSRALCRELGIKHVVCRIFSIFGPFDKPYTLMMGTIHKLLRKERLSFTPGDQIWDYLFSYDAAEALMAAAERGKSGAVYCVGSGKTRSLKAYLTEVRDLLDPSAELHFGEITYYPGQVMHLEADISALEADTGFRPRFSFEEGVRLTAEWEAKDALKA